MTVLTFAPPAIPYIIATGRLPIARTVNTHIHMTVIHMTLSMLHFSFPQYLLLASLSSFALLSSFPLKLDPVNNPDWSGTRLENVAPKDVSCLRGWWLMMLVRTAVTSRSWVLKLTPDGAT